MLSDEEIDRCRFELGYHVLQPGAAPYITDRALFKQVIQPNIEGEGENIVRDLLDKIATVKDAMAGGGSGGSSGGSTSLAVLSSSTGGLKSVGDDKIEWYPVGTTTTTKTSSGFSGSGSGGTTFDLMRGQLAYWRSELAAALGVDNMWEYRRGRASTLEVY